MVPEYDEELYELKAELCKTFADPKRLMIISYLRHGETTVGDIVKKLEVPQAVVSRHLAVLRGKGVVTARRSGVNIFYRLTDPKILEACDIVHQVMMDQVARNKELAEKLID